MERLTQRDLGGLLRSIRELYAPSDLTAFPGRILSVVPKVVASDFTSYNEVDLRAHRASSVTEPSTEANFPGADQIVNRHIAEHPLVRYYRRTYDHRAHDIRDLLTTAQFHRLGYYSEYLQVIRVEHQVGVPILLTSQTMIGVTVNRRRRGLSERERLLLDLLQPHLAQAYRNAEAVTRSSRDPVRTIQAFEELDVDRGLIFLAPGMRIRAANLRAQRLLTKYWGDSSQPGDRLPDDLEGWVRWQTARPVQADEIPPPRVPFVVERGEGRAVVRLVDGPERRFLLLEEQITSISASDLMPLGLTRREADVLVWVIHGKTNAEIARALGTSRHTVAHQLQRVFDKLGVETRTAAASLAIDSVRGVSP